MLVITLGTQASGSTWLFNVVRALFACANRRIFSSSADDGVDALDRMPVNPGDVVLKSHSMDQRFLRIARLASAKLIVSTRDPLDSMVSQRERFAHSSKLAAVDLTKSFATIESLPEDMERLSFRYEDRFTACPSTIFEIARFLGLAVSPDQGVRIFRLLEPDAVKASIAAREEGVAADTPRSLNALAHDPLAEWHPNHVGDGRVGKWRDRLEPATQIAVTGCLTPLASPELWKQRTIRWSADLFHYGVERDDAPQVDLECDGVPRFLVYGPYLHLPRGRWRATPLVEAGTAGQDVRVAVDVHLPHSGREPLVRREATVGREPDSEVSLCFDHDDHFAPVEVRLHSVTGSVGSLRFLGCDLNWLGPCADGG
jgi:hypothetical protein